jgi:transcriptional regulator with XRE-family HTH domain
MHFCVPYIFVALYAISFSIITKLLIIMINQNGTRNPKHSAKRNRKLVSKRSLDLQGQDMKGYSQSMGDLAEVPLEKRIGSLLRQYRQGSKLTLSDMSKGSDISTAMLSRIETGQASASLDALTRYATALGVPLSTLFRQIEIPKGNAQFVKKGEGMEVVRAGTEQAGYTYKMLSYNLGSKSLFDSYLIEMDENSRSFSSFHHEGTEFIHILKGKMEYRYGEDLYFMEPGDSLTFSSAVEHGPQRLLTKRIQFLAVLIYGSDDS